MNYRIALISLLAAFLLVVAACEESTDDEDVAAEDTDDAEEVQEEETDESDDSIDEDDESSEEAEQATATPEPTATPAPEPTATPEAPEAGTRENPLPFGEAARIGDWEIRVIDTIADGTQAVMEANQFNEPPAEGKQFFIVRLEATYVGDDSADFWIDVSLNAVDDGGVAYEGMDSYCGVIPDPVSDRGEAFSGATIEGNTCWAVNSETAGSLTMIAEPTFSLSDQRVFFSLQQ